jgi:hypothetical protein
MKRLNKRKTNKSNNQSQIKNNMKKLIITAIAGLLFLAVSAQDMKKVRNFVDKKDWAKAKEAIDLTLANEKEQQNWEAWFQKGLIYGEVAKDANLKASVPDAWIQSFDAYQKAFELDAKQVHTNMLLKGYPIFQNYTELQREGNDFYNKQDYTNALEKYKQADKVGRMIYKNKWELSEVDTVLYYYAGAAAMQSEKTDEAVSFFQKICDGNVSGEGYDICYRYVTYYYDQKGDAAAAEKYATLGRKFYPKDTYYDKLELDKQKKKGAGPDLFSKYEMVIQKEPKDYDIRYDYAAEMFNYLYTDLKVPAGEKQAYFDKIVSNLKSCTEVNPKNPEAFLLMGKAYYNEAASIQEEGKTIKGTTPADVQKKNDNKNKANEKLKESLPHLDAALGLFEAMSAEELKDRRTKNEYKSTVYLLQEVHRVLGNVEKEKMFQKKYDALNQ